MNTTTTGPGRHSTLFEVSRRRILAAIEYEMTLATPGKPDKQPPPIKPPGPDRPPYAPPTPGDPPVQPPNPNEPPHDPPVEPPGPDKPPLEPPDKAPPVYALYVAALRTPESTALKR